MTTLTWDTAAEWDAAASELAVRHESGDSTTDWAADDVVEKGYPTSDEGGTDLLGYWPMDEDSGTTSNDQVGTNDGTLNGATPAATGILGTDCYSFDGADDDVDYTTGAADSGNHFTFSIWVKPAAISGDSHIIVYEVDTRSFIRMQSDGTLNWALNTSSGFVNITTTTALSTGTWYHLVFAVRGADEAEIYIDGTQEASDATIDATTLGGGGFNEFLLGRHPGDKDYFEGDMDEFRFYGRELSDQEAADLDVAGHGTSNLITSEKVS